MQPRLGRRSLAPITFLIFALLLAMAAVTGASVRYFAKTQLAKSDPEIGGERFRSLEALLHKEAPALPPVKEPVVTNTTNTATTKDTPAKPVHKPPPPAPAPVLVAKSAPPPARVVPVPPVQAAAPVTAAPVAVKPPAAAPAPAVTAAMVESAKATNKIEGVNGAKLGVTHINQRSVTLHNGGEIRIGERFPSGERLLALDPDGAQIVTDKRTLIIF